MQWGCRGGWLGEDGFCCPSLVGCVGAQRTLLLWQRSRRRCPVAGLLGLITYPEPAMLSGAS